MNDGSGSVTELIVAPTKVAAHALVDVRSLVGDLGIALPADTVRHFARVLRLRTGEAVSVTDGAGGFRLCTVPLDFAASGRLEPMREVRRATRPSPSVAVGLALAKGDKPELAVQKLTELGVDRIVLFAADHSVVRWDEDKVARNLTRLRSVAVEALQQSRGLFLPVIELTSFDALASEAGAVRADAGGRAPSLHRDRLVLIGPEGGWSERERSALPDAVSVATNVLRAETAAIAAASLWVALRSRIVVATPI
jgi:16S rRNA (uracil1498-N3)-methyltransferase